MNIKLRFSLALLCGLILLTGCSDNPGQKEESWVLEQERVFTFDDGKSLNLWRNDFGDVCYKLSDGTVLLTVQAPIGPDKVYAGGVDGFDDLNTSAQAAVREFFKEQGLFYDPQVELEKAYEEYLNSKVSGKVYRERYISQAIVPTASNDNIICFLTTVTLPVNGQVTQEIRLGTVFDRKTGQVMSNWDLFTLPEDEARQWLVDALDVAPALRDEMKAALKPEYIVLFPHNLEVTFPRGTLPNLEDSYTVALDYGELKNVFQTWAIPDNS